MTTRPALHIVQIVSGRVLNGAVGHCLMLCNELARRGHTVTLVHRPQLDLGDRLNVRVRRRPEPLKLSLSAIRTLGLELLADGADVVHTHMSDAHTYGVLIRRYAGLPCAATAHSSHFQLHWTFNDLVIAPSQATARFHHRVNRVPLRKLAVIPNFLDVRDRPTVTAAARSFARGRLGIGAEEIVVGSVGEINFKKRQSDLIEAVAQMTARPAPLLVHIGGVARDPEIRRVEKVSHRLGSRLRRLGVRRDVADVLPAFDVFALGSRAEEMPIAVLEAMAAGLPVAATDVGGLSEMVEDGRTGLLAPAAHPAALAGQLDRLAADPALRARMGEAARAKVERDYAPGPIMDRVEAALRSVADLKGRR